MLALRTVALSLMALVAVSQPAVAAEFKPFDRATFDAAQKAGRPILVEVNAWWCPVCASQSKTIKATVIAPAYAKLLVLRINYDKQKSEWQAFAVQKQSTLIAFKGGRELGRVSYITDKATIQTLLATTTR
jgi:thioredoxin-like negative regulator of GroEL